MTALTLCKAGRTVGHPDSHMANFLTIRRTAGLKAEKKSKTGYAESIQP